MRGRRPTHATVVSYLALFIALSGTSYAAVKITGRDVKDRSLGVRDLSLEARAALRGRRGATGAPGAAGVPGERGPAGEDGTSAGYSKGEADERFVARRPLELYP